MASWYIQRMRKVRAMKLPQAEKHVLLVLATYGDKHGKAYPSAGTLATDCGMSEKHIRTLLRKLRKRKAIVPVGRGPKGVTVYQVGTHDMGTHEDTTPPTHEVGSPPTHEVGTKGAMEGAIEGNPPMSPRPGGIYDTALGKRMLAKDVQLMAKMTARLLDNLAEYGDEGWDPDSKPAVANTHQVLKKEFSGIRERDTQQAMRIALAQYRGEA